MRHVRGKGEPNDVAKEDPTNSKVGGSRPILSVVSTDVESDVEDELFASVRSVRRELGRLLRGLQASGRSLATFPDVLVTRLAHSDSVTAGYLVNPDAADPDEVSRATASLRDIEQWLRFRMGATESAEVKRCELRVHLRDEDLRAPLLHSDWSEAEAFADDGIEDYGDASHANVRRALATLDDERLCVVGRRLGVLIGAGPDVLEEWSRRRVEQGIAKTLSDAQLLAVLLATLSHDAHRLLAALVRGTVDTATMRQLVRTLSLDGYEEEQRSAATSGARMQVQAVRTMLVHPLHMLCECGLVYVNDGERLWVPVALQRRIDGVLRAFGVL